MSTRSLSMFYVMRSVPKIFIWTWVLNALSDLHEFFSYALFIPSVLYVPCILYSRSVASASVRLLHDKQNNPHYRSRVATYVPQDLHGARLWLRPLSSRYGDEGLRHYLWEGTKRLTRCRYDIHSYIYYIYLYTYVRIHIGICIYLFGQNYNNSLSTSFWFWIPCS